MGTCLELNWGAQLVVASGGLAMAAGGETLVSPSGKACLPMRWAPPNLTFGYA